MRAGLARAGDLDYPTRFMSKRPNQVGAVATPLKRERAADLQLDKRGMTAVDWITGVPGWIGPLIAALALAVSGCSLFISWRMAHHTIAAERVTAWIELGLTGNPEWLVATLSVKNPSPNDIKVQKISIGLPDFRLGDIVEASIDNGKGNRILPKEFTVKNHSIGMPLPLAIGAGETGKSNFLIYQPAHSRRRSTKVNVMYWTLEPKQKWRILPVRIETRPAF